MILKLVKLKLILLIALGVLLSGCANFGKDGHFSRFGRAKQVDSFAFYGEEISLAKEQELLSEHVVYFGYDKDELEDRFKLVLLAHAKNMLEHPDLKLRVDGHTDERGSAEYNIGLAERRARAVVRFLELKGVRSDKLVTVSYGKEKPASIGHNEEAWRLNRRAELTYE